MDIVNAPGRGMWDFHTRSHTPVLRLLAKWIVIPLDTACLSSLKQKLEVEADGLSETKTQYQISMLNQRSCLLIEILFWYIVYFLFHL